jgi:hypothetical protein
VSNDRNDPKVFVSSRRIRQFHALRRWSTPFIQSRCHEWRSLADVPLSFAITGAGLECSGKRVSFRYAKMLMMAIKFVECYHYIVIEEGKDIVRAKYEAPTPMLGDPPRKTVYLFVPENEHSAPLWSFAPFPWLDSPKVESTWCERYVFHVFRTWISHRIACRTDMPTL